MWCFLKKFVGSVNELEVNVGWKNKHLSHINLHVGMHNSVLVLIEYFHCPSTVYYFIVRD